jgi:CRP/FNR family cyclic AMP-dependent transcriptional regulator
LNILFMVPVLKWKEFPGVGDQTAMPKHRPVFNPQTFLFTEGAGREMRSVHGGQTIYAQGDEADALFAIHSGKIKLSVKSNAGKEATLDILSDGDFVGMDAIAGQLSHTASASAITDCSLLRIERNAMMLALTQQVKLANLFLAYVLTRCIRYQQDIVDQHCNPSEKRLARTLLLLAHFDGQESSETVLARTSHATLAEMVGTTRSRVCFFMKKFKDSGFIYYDTKSKLLRVHRTLLTFCAQ